MSTPCETDKMTENLVHQRELVIRPQPYGRLLVTYALLMAYGVLGIIGYVPSLVTVYGPWGFVIPGLIFISSAFAFVGTLRSRAKQVFKLEIISTVALCVLMILYSAAILIFVVASNKEQSIASFLLPLIILVPPFARTIDLVRAPK